MLNELTLDEMSKIKKNYLKNEKKAIFAFLAVIFLLLFHFFRPTRSGNSILDWKSYGFIFYFFVVILAFISICAFVFLRYDVKRRMINESKHYKKLNLKGQVSKVWKNKKVLIKTNDEWEFEYSLKNTDGVKKGSLVNIVYENFTTTILSVEF